MLDFPLVIVARLSNQTSDDDGCTMTTRTFTKGDVEEGLRQYNAYCRRYGFPEETLAGLGWVDGRAPVHDIVIGVEEVIEVRNLYVEFVLKVVYPDGNTGRRLKRVDFNRTLTVLLILNRDLMIYRQFRHGVGGPRISTLRGWSTTEDQSHEGRVRALIRERLGEDFLKELGEYTLTRIADYDEDDAMRMTPNDIYAVIKNGVRRDSLALKHAGNKFRFIDLAPVREALEDKGGIRALRVFQGCIREIRGGQTLVALEALQGEMIKYLNGEPSPAGEAILSRKD